MTIFNLKINTIYRTYSYNAIILEIGWWLWRRKICIVKSISNKCFIIFRFIRIIANLCQIPLSLKTKIRLNLDFYNKNFLNFRIYLLPWWCCININEKWLARLWYNYFLLIDMLAWYQALFRVENFLRFPCRVPSLLSLLPRPSCTRQFQAMHLSKSNSTISTFSIAKRHAQL